MRIKYFFILVSFVSVSLAASEVLQDQFAPAVFGELTIGKATLATMKRRFGNPSDTYRDRSGATWLYYRDIGPVPGKVEIVSATNSQIIDFVTVYPDNLTLDDAKKLFGSNFRVIRYAFDDCLSNGGDAPIYESPTGPLELTVYASRGIALRADRNRVTEIEYMRKPVGAKESRCKGKSSPEPASKAGKRPSTLNKPTSPKGP